MSKKERHYFTKAKFMNDYSAVFTPEEIESKPKNVHGFFDKKVYKENKRKYNL